MIIRNATTDDLHAIHHIESLCFPPNEAASLDSFSKRLQVFPHHFWLLEEDGQLIGLINGMVTNNGTISDEMFAHAELHNEHGSWQSIFGIAVLPASRRKGYAKKLIRHLIEKSKEQ